MKKMILSSIVIGVCGLGIGWVVFFNPSSTIPTGGAGLVSKVAFSPNGRFIAAATDETVQIWNADDHRRIIQIGTNWPPRGWSQQALAWSPDSQRVAVDGPDGRMDIYNARTGTLLGSFTSPHQPTSSLFDLAWSAQDYIAIAYAGNRVEVLRAADYHLLYTFEVPPTGLQSQWNTVNAVSFTPDGSLLAAASSDGHVRLWRMVDGIAENDIFAHERPIRSIAFNPAGSVLASGGDDTLIKLWSVDTGILQSTLAGHSEEIHSLAFRPDGTTLVSGAGHFADNAAEASDATVRLWDVTSRLSKIYGSHPYVVWTIAVSPDGRQIVSGGLGEGIKIWTTP
jgi:WD40 repeat protein